MAIIYLKKKKKKKEGILYEKVFGVICCMYHPLACRAGSRHFGA
jgi:hypothetical protein